LEKNILMIEDDTHVCAFVKKGLTEEKYHVEVVNDGIEGVKLFENGNFDLILLDIMLPTISGLEVCTKIRAKSNVPILLLTALGTAENVALGLNMGADDYLVKPFKFIELLARIKSLLRRYDSSEYKTNASEHTYTFNEIELNDYTKEVKCAGNLITLTSTEYKLLYTFITNPKKVISRKEILDKVWDVNYELGTNVVDVYVNYLRKKLDKYLDKKYIQTVIGMGYVLKD
jgi:two-component system, OmpR family, copper resistance phosphate regulon response regulator CusR